MNMKIFVINHHSSSECGFLNFGVPIIIPLVSLFRMTVELGRSLGFWWELLRQRARYDAVWHQRPEIWKRKYGWLRGFRLQETFLQNFPRVQGLIYCNYIYTHTVYPILCVFLSFFGATNNYILAFRRWFTPTRWFLRWTYTVSYSCGSRFCFQN